MVDRLHDTLWFPGKRAQARSQVTPETLDTLFPPEVAVLVCHGIAGSPVNLSSLIQRLYEKWGGKIIFCAPVLPGHGSQPEDLLGVTWKDWVTSIHGVIEELFAMGVKKIILVGYSMGAEIISVVASEMSDDERFSGFMSGPEKVQDARAPLLSLSVVGQAVRRFKPWISIVGAPDKGENPESFSYDQVPSETVHQLNLVRNAGRKARGVINPGVKAKLIHGTKDETAKPGGAIKMFKKIAPSSKSLVFIDGADHFFTEQSHKDELFTEADRFLIDVFRDLLSK